MRQVLPPSATVISQSVKNPIDGRNLAPYLVGSLVTSSDNSPRIPSAQADQIGNCRTTVGFRKFNEARYWRGCAIGGDPWSTQ